MVLRWEKAWFAQRNGMDSMYELKLCVVTSYDADVDNLRKVKVAGDLDELIGVALVKV